MINYIENRIVSWHSEIRRFHFDTDSIIDKNVLLFGHEDWYEYFSHICNVVSYYDIDIEDYLNQIDLVVVIPSLDLRNDSFSKELAKNEEKFKDLFHLFSSKQIPVVGISLNTDVNNVYTEFFSSMIEVINISSSQIETDESQRGLFCSFSFNPFMDGFAINKTAEFEHYKIIAQNSHIFKNSKYFKEVTRILKKNLVIFDYDYSSREYRLDKEIYNAEFIGKVNTISYRALLKNAQIQLFFDDSTISDDLLNKRIIENNASYTISIIVSKRKDYFEKIGAVVCDNIYTMLDYVSIFTNLPEYREMIAQKNWRLVHDRYSLYKLALKLTNLSLPLVTMITPTMRPENIENILSNYDGQTYNHKELIIVVNGKVDGDSFLQMKRKLHFRDDITIVRLSQDVLAAGALNAGIIKAKGDFVFRIDDDDVYGPNYIQDTMLHYFSTNADFLGKKMEYIYMTNSKTLLRRKINDKKQTFRLDIFSNYFHNIAGNSFGLKRSFVLDNMFRFGTAGYADSDLLLSFEKLANKPLTAYTDTRSLVILRNDPEQHTWEAEDYFFEKDAIAKYDSYQWFLKEDEEIK